MFLPPRRHVGSALVINAELVLYHPMQQHSFCVTERSGISVLVGCIKQLMQNLWPKYAKMRTPWNRATSRVCRALSLVNVLYTYAN
jgi:hypothetical protein